MQKISLNVDDLHVTTFEAAPAVAPSAAVPVIVSDSYESWECSCDPIACLQTATTSD
jgi:hypothetical protein